MNEYEIFAAALEHPTEAERQAFLDEVCDRDMRSRIERLLKEQSQLGSFLEHPPLESAADPLTGVDATILYATGSTYNDEMLHTEQLERGPNAHEHDDEISLDFLEPPTLSDSLGRLGHYEILEVVGRGAFGTVLRAFDEKLERIVAVKMLAPELAATSPARKRFLREARASAQIRHENVVAIYDVEDEPTPYLVMEYIPGKTLQQRLDEHGPLDLFDVLRLGKQIADGLAAAHAQGLIHRDIKPGNILLEGGMNERVKITDFGLARTADDASMTQSGVIAGTPMYMAPEQAHGEKLDQRADLFSFGSVLYQMLSGRPPFRAPTTMAVLKRVMEDTPRPIPEIIPETPAWICELIAHLHEKDPENRYSSAKEVSELLAKCTKELEAGRVPEIPNPSKTVADQTPPAMVPTSPAKSLVRSPLVKLATAVLILFGLLGITEATGVTKFASTVIRLTTGSGTLVIETDDPGVKFTIDGEEVTITGGGVESLTLRPGDYTVTALKNGKPFKQELVSITRNGQTVVRMSLEPAPKVASSEIQKSDDRWPGWPTDAPPPAIAPFDAEQAKAHQEAWAKYLGVPVEMKNSVGMKLVVIPPGKATMGEGDNVVDVSLTQPFRLSIHEVTQGQWQAVMETAPWKDKPNVQEGENVAATFVSWKDAMEFCRRLTEREQGAGKFPDGWEYRLPTEAEWEWACRAGTTTRFWFGDDMTQMGQYGWSNTNTMLVNEAYPHAVGLKLPNGWGLYDVHGNVWELCYDGEGKLKGGTDPIGGQGSFRNYRGGSWNMPHGYCSSTVRFGGDWSTRNNSLGFRLALLPVRQRLNAEPASALAPFTDIDIARIAALPAAQQVEEVRKELIRRNAGFDGHVEHRIKDGVVVELRFPSDHVADISPLRALTQWQRLSCGSETDKGQLRDLSPLRGLQLTYLHIERNRVSDLSPLQGMKLVQLYCSATNVVDLSPLHGMPLQVLYCAFTRVSDLSPLIGMPLTSLQVEGTEVSDMSPVQGMRLSGQVAIGRHVTDLTPLKGMPLHTLTCAGATRLSDLTPLKGMPLTLSYLNLVRTQVSDLTPLQGMPLKDLNLHGTRVSDLTPIGGMALTRVLVDTKRITDFSVIRSMKTLKKINEQPVAEFWKAVDAEASTQTLPEANTQPQEQLKEATESRGVLDPVYAQFERFRAVQDSKELSDKIWRGCVRISGLDHARPIRAHQEFDSSTEEEYRNRETLGGGLGTDQVARQEFYFSGSLDGIC